MSNWIPFCFPKCPRCQKGWSKNSHRNCFLNGNLLVDPCLRQVQCDSCYKEWHIMSSEFHCSCGYIFQASEIENALSTTQLLRDRLIQKLNEMDSYERSIKTKSKDSLKQWIGSISYEIGKLLGTTASQAKLLIENFFEKWFN